MTIQIEDAVVSQVIECWESSKNALLLMGRLILEQIQIHNLAMKRNTRPDIIRYFMGVLKVEYAAIDDYVRVAERWSDDKLAEIGQEVPYTILRNTNPNNPDEMELCKTAMDQGWNATRFKMEKSAMVNDGGSEHVNPIPKLHYARMNLADLRRCRLPASVLEQIELADDILSDCEDRLKNQNMIGSTVLVM